MRCPVNAYSVVSRKGPLGFGISRCPEWHKEEHENLLALFDINISYKELPYIPEGKMANVGDYEHLRILKARMTMKGKAGKPLGMEKLAKDLQRSSGTVHRHINYHNNRVHSVGICDKCERVGSELAKVAVD